MEPFLQFLKDLRASINAQLKALPPLEQFEAASQLSWPLRQLQEYGESLTNQIGEIQSKVERFVSEQAERLRAEVRSELASSGEFVLKADAETAASTARADGERAAREAIQAEIAETNTLRERRAKVVTDGVIPAVLAERLGDEIFRGEDFMDRVNKVGERAQKISKLGLAPEGVNAALAEMASIPVDESGDAVFEGRLATIQQIAASAKPAGEHAERAGKREGKAPLDQPGAEEGKAAPRKYGF